MSRMGTSSRSKLRFETSFNASMGMTNTCLAKVQFKIDKERIRHENEVKMLNKIEKAELRLAQRELEEVKKELHALKAYKLVAKQTAFEKFDRVMVKRREKIEKRKQENQLVNFSNPGKRETNSPTPDHSQNDSKSFNNERRRSSASGQVFVTLGDIMDSDDVLRKKSREIVEQRRKSLASLCGDDDEDGKSQKGFGLRKWLKSSPRKKSISGKEAKSIYSNKVLKTENGPHDVEHNFSEKQRRKSKIGAAGDLLESVIREDTKAEKEEEEEGDESCNKVDKESVDENEDVSRVKRLVVSGRKGYKMGKTPKGVFITSNENHNDEGEQENITNRHRSTADNNRGNTELRPMTLFEIAKLYEEKKAQKLEENENKLMNHQRRKAQREYEIFRLKMQQQQQRRKSQAEQSSMGISHILRSADQTKVDLSNVAAQASTAMETGKQEINNQGLHSQPNHEDQSQNASQKTLDVKSSSESQKLPSSAPFTLTSSWNKVTTSPLPPSSSPDGTLAGSVPPSTSSAPIRGLARFKNAAAAVSVQQKLCRTDQSDMMKSVAAAVMIKSNTTKGRLPSSFLSGGVFSWTSPRDDTKTDIPPLEASHRNPDDIIIRPLKMPRSVQAEHEKKWGDLMVNAHYAVFWKAKALREDTGTLNPRQARRQGKEKASPRRALFPGACKTTWAMKNYVKQEVTDVLKSWEPDNLRRQRNRKLAEKVSLPKFIDRIRTTNNILRSFRQFRYRKSDDDQEKDSDLDAADGEDDDDDDEIKEDICDKDIMLSQ